MGKKAEEKLYGAVACPMKANQPVMKAACQHCEILPHECKAQRIKIQNEQERRAAARR